MKKLNHLTQKSVDAAKPEFKEYTLWDLHIPGFGLRVRPSGSKTFTLLYRIHGKKQRRYSVGAAHVFTVKEARHKARKLLQAISDGEDPSEARQNARHTTVCDLFEIYDVLRMERFSVGHRVRVKGIFNNEILPNLGHKPIGQITKADIKKITDKKTSEGKRSMANNIHRAMSAFLSWCCHDQLILEWNPIAGMKNPNRKSSRDRYLNEKELVAIWKYSEEIGLKWRVAIRLLMLTGQRKNEVIAAKIDEFSLQDKLWNIPKNRTKNRKPQQVFLSDLAVDEIQKLECSKNQTFLLQSNRSSEPKPISGDSGGCRKLRQIVPVEDWRIHDLRRSVATHMARLGIDLHVIQVVLNHSSGFRSSVTAIYNRYNYEKEARYAWDLWAQTLEKWIILYQNDLPESLEDEVYL